MPRVRGISKSSLWTAWKNVRKQLSRSAQRDVADFIEYDIDPDWWIGRLLRELDAGRYEPSNPHRFTSAKKMGFSRRMTQPAIVDLVLYRAVVDDLCKRAKKRERRHVYFAQSTLSRRRREVGEADPTYVYVSGNVMAAWLKYDQYRKHLLLEAVHPFIVTADVSNFFDTILYDRVVDALHGLGGDRNMVGLLFFILERLSIRDAFNESPRIGLPVDEFDCSRTLAHMVLFAHDDRMIKVVGEGSYVRWMDDQNFGAAGYAAGLQILKQCGDSLARLHLTPNASKSRIMSLAEASQHFHFDVNADLDALDALPRTTLNEKRQLRVAVGKAWRIHRASEQRGGEWGKVLKRLYRLAGIAGARVLLHRAGRDIVRDPTLAERIADYVRVIGGSGAYVKFVTGLWAHDEQVYADVNQILADGLLELEPSAAEGKAIRKLAVDLLAARYSMPGWQRCASIAPLLILRYGGAGSAVLLRRLVKKISDDSQPAIAKAMVAVYVSFGRAEYEEAVDVASRLRNNHLAHFLTMLSAIRKYETVPDRFKVRREPTFDLVANRKRIDIRRLLGLRVLRLNGRPAVKNWIRDTKAWMVSQDVSVFDRALIERLL